MKTKNYHQVTDKSIMEVKQYLLAIAPNHQDVDDIVNSSMDIYEIKKNLHKNAKLELAVFSKIKACLDQSQDFDEMEHHLIFLNLIFYQHFHPVRLYEYRLFQYIMDHQALTLETYCIMRHLIEFKGKVLPEFILYLCSKMEVEGATDLLIAEVLCLEHEYRYVYPYLQNIDLDDLGIFQKGLYHYSPYKYHRVLRKQGKLRKAYI